MPGNPCLHVPRGHAGPPCVHREAGLLPGRGTDGPDHHSQVPDPGPSMNRVRDDRSRTGWINVPVPETERCENHLSLVTATHPVYPLIVNCLKDTDTQRPSAQQICHWLLLLRDSPQYQQSHEARGGGEQREREIQERDQLIQQLREENEAREREREREREERERERGRGRERGRAGGEGRERVRVFGNS